MPSAGRLAWPPATHTSARRSAVLQGLVPHLAPQGMVGQVIHLLVPPVAGQRARLHHTPHMEPQRLSGAGTPGGGRQHVAARAPLGGLE